MNGIKEFIEGINFEGNIGLDSIRLLNHHGKYVTAEHSIRVAAQAKELARHFGEDETEAEIAGFLHDISVIIPNERRLELTEQLGVEVLPEESPYPFILHQKLSAALAKEVFGISDREILSAISCHTTLKKKAGLLDMILFVSDKLQWDQDGTPPYIEALKEGLEKSIEHAAFAFLRYLIDNKATLLMLHPWMLEAYEELSAKNLL